MKIITYLSKQWTLRWRDIINATGSAAFTAAMTFFLDQMQLMGSNFNFKQALSASVLVFIYHIGRKLIEPHKLITMQKVEKEDLPLAEQVAEQANDQGVPAPNVTIQSGDGDNPPNNNDPTHPPKPPKKPVE